MIKYTVQVDIKKDLETVTKLFTNYKLMPKWQPALTQIYHLSGTTLSVGSVTELTYEFNNQTMVMQETICQNQLPHLFIATYEVENTWNQCINHFIEEDHHTRWIMTSEFRFKTNQDMPKQTFIEKTTRSMMAFKKFVESNAITDM
ncbi:MAG: SRPBCC family protein [Bacillota bacterium]